MNKQETGYVPANTINVITKLHGTFQTEVDQELQKTNPLAERGIFLVDVPEGVVWGYDSKQYIYDESNQIIRRNMSKGFSVNVIKVNDSISEINKLKDK